jgi:hypothetical protein
MRDEPQPVYRFTLSLQNLHDMMVLIHMDLLAVVRV